MRRPLAVVLRGLAALPVLLQHVFKSAAVVGGSAGFQSALCLANVVMLSIGACNKLLCKAGSRLPAAGHGVGGWSW